MEEQVKKLSEDELKNIANQWKNEAEMWRRKAYEEAGKTNRISLLLEYLKLQCGFDEAGKSLFSQEQIEVMSGELYAALYTQKDDSLEAPVIPISKPLE